MKNINFCNVNVKIVCAHKGGERKEEGEEGWCFDERGIQERLGKRAAVVLRHPKYIRLKTIFLIKNCIDSLEAMSARLVGCTSTAVDIPKNADSSYSDTLNMKRIEDEIRRFTLDSQGEADTSAHMLDATGAKAM